MRRPNAPRQASCHDHPPEIPSYSSPNRRSRSFLSNGLVATATVFAAAAGLLYFLILSSPQKFGIIIDGGSTGTRIHVIVYRNNWGAMLPINLGLTASMKVVPGLSAYADSPDEAANSLMKLLEFGKERVPKNRWGETEVRLMATAGLRLLDEDVAQRILKSCRRLLRGSGFKFVDDWASVISGADEGIYAWVAANYALGTLGKDAQETTGILELGGASAQITFVPSEPIPPEFSHVLKFGQVIYNLYSHSFLHLGQNMAYEYLHQLFSSSDFKTSTESLLEGLYRDPCAPKGYLYGVVQQKLAADANNTNMDFSRIPHAFGNFSECRSAALKLLQRKKVGRRLYLGSTFIPKLQGRLVATENFFHTSKFLGLGPSSFLSDLALAGEQFCEEDWSKLRNKHLALEEEDLLRYCFSSAYIVALLHDCLGIAMNDSSIVFANQVGQLPLDWALGALILQKTAEIAQHSNSIAAIFSAIPSSMFYVFVFILILAFTGLSILKWWKPQFKLKTV